MKKKIDKTKLLKRAGVCAALLVCLYVLWCHSLKNDIIWENVRVNGVSLKNLTKEQAFQAVQEQFKKDYQNQKVTISLNEKEYDANIFPVLGLDADDVIEKAYQLGHGKWYQRGTDRIRLMNESGDVQDVEVFPTAAHREEIDQVIKQAKLPRVSTVVETTGRVTSAALVLKKGVSGMNIDKKALSDAIVKTIDSQSYDDSIACPIVETKPAEIDFQEYCDRIAREVQDAYLGEENEIIPSVTGITFDVEKAKKKFDKAKEGSTVTIQFKITKPKVTTADIEALPYLDILGSYTTYGGGTKERITNLQLAIAGINGKEIQPGETFSFSDALGPRTEERGYQMATVIVSGNYAKGIGGGICQVSSTLFVASLYANMEITERHNHSARVDYSEDGLDAAIAWGSQDFRFTNSSSYPVKISATYINGAVNVKIYGTKESTNTVSLSTEHQSENVCTTYRSLVDEDGEVLDTKQICTSSYKQ